jgi:glucose dehydrogenase
MDRSQRNRSPSRLAKLLLALLFLVISIFGVFSLLSPLSSAAGNVNGTWFFEGQNQQNTWYSPQTLINPANVDGLAPKWSIALKQIAGTPVVAGDIVYVSGGTFFPGDIYAINETSGQLIWEDGPGHGTGLNFSTIAGAAVDNGQVFAATIQNELVSLDSRTGSLTWAVPMDERLTENPVAKYSGPQAAPAVYDGEVIIGNVQENQAAGGFVRAFGESSGNLLWTFYVVPASPIGSSTNQTFYKNSWGYCDYCGGGDLWSIPAVDQKTGIIYFGTGDPSPSFNSSQRSPSPSYSNLYTDCIIALNATNGRMIWYYQTTQADEHDWDAGMPVQLFTTTINGVQNTEVVGAGSKGGYYYELYASNGSLIHSTPLGIHENDNLPPSKKGVVIYPGSFGGVNTFSSYDPMTNMIYTMTYNRPSNYTESDITLNGQGGKGSDVPDAVRNSTLYAIDASTGEVVWSVTLPGLGGGASSTNNLVFASDGNGTFYSFDAETGGVLWKYDTRLQSFDALTNWGPPAIVDGLVLETSISNNGGVFAFTTNTNITETSYPSSTATSTLLSSVTPSTTIASNTLAPSASSIVSTFSRSASGSGVGFSAISPTILQISVILIALGISTVAFLLFSRHR